MGIVRVQVSQFQSSARPWGFDHLEEVESTAGRGSAQWGIQSLRELQIWKGTSREPQEAGSPHYGSSYPGHSGSGSGSGHT